MPLIRSKTFALKRGFLRTAIRASALALAGLSLAAGAAQADPWACQRFKAELASLNDGAGTAQALHNEIGRLQAYFRSLNCEGGKFLFFDTRPPQCGAVEQRIRALNATYGGDDGAVFVARRRQLNAAIASACATPAPSLAADGPPGEQTARGGAQVICVKTCDGSYFPMNNLPDGREGANEMCQALCPGTEAIAYSMPHGDDALKHAAALKGNRAYAALSTAFKFRTSFTPSCSCKRDGQTWAQSLVKAESMLVRHKGDIFVTPMQAEALSRPKVRLTLVGHADRTAAELAADAAGRKDPVAGPLPGPAVASDADVPSHALGPTLVRAAEERGSVRVIAPAMIPAPGRTGPP